MGNWKLEAAKMALYLGFPVGAFLLFNSPKIYEGSLLEWRKEIQKINDKGDPERAKEIFEEAKRKKFQNKLEEKTTHLPDSIPYLLVGGGTASFAAFRAIKANDPKARVIVITDEQFNPYMRPPLSKELWFTDSDLAKKLSFKQWNGRERSIFFEHDEFYCPLKDLKDKETGGVSIVNGRQVIKIDAVEKKAYLENGQIIGYDKCLIATGGRPKNIPPFSNAPDDVQRRVILYRGIKDFKLLNDAFRRSKSVTIVGGGFLGSELACALGNRSKTTKSNITINQIFPESGNMGKVLPEYLCKWTTTKVRSEGILIN